ncbi:hypothetical protein JIN84_02105 [Luteolibacter yonseiensis]|uniref:Uncharacterized protein n=1 Tax=Luteolibacter yonseiensis TaxID=1144680 RepID=A0A934V5W7_9BACT|nr:hypothetical protein [Luteolibacter yonseiensis]MBK1814387.1 hypothetical protein [Luteolibacter yonseiensis]
MPVACFICAWLAPAKLPFNFQNLILFAAVAGFIFAVAVIFWFFTERHTAKVKCLAENLIFRNVPR